MKRCILTMPTYGPVEPEVVKSVMDAVMFAASFGVRWAGQVSTDRESWSSARNRPAEAVRNRDEVDGIIWVDSDMLVPQDAFARLAAHDLDLVSALYFQRQPPYWPNIFKYSDERKKFIRLKEWPENTVAPTGGFGFGCCYTSTRLLRALPEKPFGFGEFSEDLGLCRMATLAGFQPHVDTGIECGHYEKPSWSSRKKFDRWKRVLLKGDQIDGGDYGLVHDVGKADLRGVPANASESA